MADSSSFPGVAGKGKTADGQAGDDGQGDAPEVTHDLLLADGTTVESSGGIPTHVAVGDRQVPVLFAHAR